VYDTNGPNVSLLTPPPAGTWDQNGEFVVTDAVCPTSDAMTEIHFTGKDPEGNEPVTFACILDGATTWNCTSGPNSGVATWNALPTGTHQLQIIGYDALGNAGPTNLSAPSHVGVLVRFVVAACG
jgi:hypothetical protein